MLMNNNEYLDLVQTIKQEIQQAQYKATLSVNKELIRIGKLAKISKHFSFHSARHTNATLLIYKGANITTVQKLLGHKNLATTQIYGEVMGSTIIRDLKKCQKR